MARRNIAHVKAGTIDQAPAVLGVPAARYLDPERARLETERIFRRLPLMLALGSELAAPGAFKTMDVVGVPVLIVRGSDGGPRAFVNSCAHRGAQVVTAPAGRAQRFVCPYHAWAYDEDGVLVGIQSPGDFGEIDRSCHGLVRLPVAERAGLVWVTLDPRSTLEIDAFLCGYDRVLESFGFASWQVFDRRVVAGPNWKIAYDGYLDFYHLPILHKASFGSGLPSRALYDGFGPHQRVSFPNPGLLRFEEQPEEDWDVAELLGGVWTVFPHVSIATFDAGGRAVLLSQLFPGGSPFESITVQSLVMEELPSGEERAAAEKLFELLGFVVREEDYATGLRQQRALASGARREVLFGRNEGGGQRFHDWVERLLALSDEELGGAFAAR